MKMIKVNAIALALTALVTTTSALASTYTFNFNNFSHSTNKVFLPLTPGSKLVINNVTGFGANTFPLVTVEGSTNIHHNTNMVNRGNGQYVGTAVTSHTSTMTNDSKHIVNVILSYQKA